MKNTSFQAKCLGIALIAIFVLVSETFAIPSSDVFLRIRREAEAAPEAEPEPATTASAADSMPTSVTVSSTLSSSTTMSPHASDGIQCTTGDIDSLKMSCPDNNNCPSDQTTMEQCCHCLSTCCMMMGKNDEGSTSEPETSTGKGSNIGKKVKDAVNSAEGWIKNAGQSIKNTWDKAKEGIKNTASDVKDKVKHGISSVSNKMKNSTSNETDTGSDMNTSSGDSSSNESSTGSSVATTSIPGYKKMKRRDIHGVNRYPSHSYVSSIYGTGNEGRGYDDSDSASNEYAWSKKTTTTTGGHGEDDRRYKRSNTSQQKQPDMSSNSSNSSASTPTSPSTESSNTRNKRSDHSHSDGMNCTQAQMSSDSTTNRNGESHRRKRDQSSSNSNGNTNTQTMETSTSSTSTSEKKNDQQSSSRSKRSSNMDTTTTKPSMESSATMPTSNGKVNSTGESRTKRDTIANTGSKSDKDEQSSSSDSFSSTETAATSSEAGSDEESDYGNWSDADKHGNNNSKSNSSFFVSIHLSNPSEKMMKNETVSSSSKISRKRSSRGSSGDGRKEKRGTIRSPPPASYSGTRNSMSYYSHEQVNAQVDHPPVVYPDGSGEGVSSTSSPIYFPPYNFNSNGKNYNQYGNVKYEHGRNGKTMRKISKRRSSSSTVEPPFYQDFLSEEDSEYFPILESTPVTGSPGWPISGLGEWGSSSSMTGSVSNKCRNHKGSHHHYHHMNNPDCNDEHHHYHHDNAQENEEEDMGGGTLDSGSFKFGQDNHHDNHGNSKYFYKQSSGSQNNNADQSHTYHHDHLQEEQHHHNHNNKNHNEKNEQSNEDTWGYGNGVISSGDADAGTPGVCRPLAGGAKCASLRLDSAQCLYDTDCSGTKKCCFYNCDPQKIVGICEHVTYTVTNS